MKHTKKTPLFSIITVCYNEEKNIEKTCKSVSEQTSKEFEWIVIDGKSTDNTLDILKKYNKKITVLISEKDEGICDAYNKGIKKARGEYILFLNGGDPINNNNVIKQASSLIKKDNKKADIYYGDVLYENGELVSFEKSVLDKKFFQSKTISHEATFIRANLFKKYGEYNKQYKIVGDFDFWVKAIVVNKVKTKHLPITVSIFKLNGVSTDYRFAKKQIEERNGVLISYGIINKYQAFFARLKWGTLSILKRIKVYNVSRKYFRKYFKR